MDLRNLSDRRNLILLAAITVCAQGWLYLYMKRRDRRLRVKRINRVKERGRHGFHANLFKTQNNTQESNRMRVLSWLQQSYVENPKSEPIDADECLDDPDLKIVGSPKTPRLIR